MNRLTSTLAVAAMTAGLLAASDAAMAVTWYSSSSPLLAKEDGVTQGGAYGNFTNVEGTYARSRSARRDYRPGGDGVYVQTSFQFYYKPRTATEPYWVPVRSDQTARTTSGSWLIDNPTQALRGDATQARGAMKVCEDQNLSPDPCSATAIRTFSY